LNPTGCQVYSFKKPSAEELDHTFLWRCMKALPERGRFGIFNRSYYEDVLVVKVHPELLKASPWPPGNPGKNFWAERYEDINNFETHLVRNGTVVVKFYLHLSKDEQKKQLLERLEDPEKHWKFSLGDLGERALWDEYMKAYEDCLEATSTEWAPWYVIPADQKWAARALVATVLADTIRKLDLRYPEVSAEQKAKLIEAERQLRAE
jgi:PPK2 family polyphosphate:nucleotide phosphotransferase